MLLLVLSVHCMSSAAAQLGAVLYLKHAVKSGVGCLHAYVVAVFTIALQSIVEPRDNEYQQDMQTPCRMLIICHADITAYQQAHVAKQCAHAVMRCRWRI